MTGYLAIPLFIVYAHWWALGGSGRDGRVVTATAAIHQALKIQPMLQKSRNCLTELNGWYPDSEHGPGVLATRVRDTNTMLTFECDQARKESSVPIHGFVDDHAHVEGPFDGPLTITYGHFTTPESKVIPTNPDIRALAELLACGES